MSKEVISFIIYIFT